MDTTGSTPGGEGQPKRKWPVWLIVVLILVVVCCCCLALTASGSALWNFGDTWFGITRGLGQLLPA